MTVIAAIAALGVFGSAFTNIGRRRSAASRLVPSSRSSGSLRSLVSPRAHHSARRDRRRVERDLPALAEAMAREVRAGATVAMALTRAGASLGGTAGSAVAAIDREIASGRSIATALRSWSDAVGSAPLDQVVATVVLASELGGASADAFEAVAAGLRDRAEVDDEIGSLTAQSRASAALLTGLPPAATALLAVLEPATIRFLVGSAAGAVCLVSSLALLIGGWWWMNRLVGAVR